MNAPAQTALTVPTNATKAQRIAISLQADRTPLPNIPEDIDSVLLPYLPDHGQRAAAMTPANTADRAQLLTAPPSMTVERTDHAHGGTPIISFTLPPDGAISRVEGVLWPEMGLSGTRASRFLLEWLKIRKFMAACAAAGCRSTDPGQWRVVSAIYRDLHDAIDLGIRGSRHSQAEDTLHGLANGEISKPVWGAVGGGLSGQIGVEPVYSEKALLTELSAGDPKRYGKAQGTGEGLQVTINLQMAELSGPVIEAEEIQIEDSPDIES